MSGRVFDGRIARGIAPDDRARQERLKATARALVTAVRDGLVRDGVVRLHGFGTFRLRPVAARRGRHPRTGEPIEIPAGWRVMFRPAKALRERIEPDRAPALPIGEPHASREAMLAASAAAAAETIGRGAGRIPAEGIAPPPVEPERAAAAAMSEPKFSLQGPTPPAPADLEADSRVTRSPAALTRAPAANEPSPTESPATEPPVPESKAAEQQATSGARSRRYGSRYALVLLFVLLLGGLAWLLRPGDSPAPRMVEEPDATASGEAPGDAGTGSPDTGTASGGIASEEPETATAGTEPTSGQSGADDGATTVGEMADAPSRATAGRDAPVSPDNARAVGDGGRDTAGTAVGSTETTTSGRTDTGEDSARADEPEDTISTTAASPAPAPEAPAPSAAENAGSGEEAMAALSRAAEATRVTPVDTADAADEAATAGDASGAAGTDAAAAGGEPYFSGRDYTVRPGDTLWGLADRHYVNPYYWPHIWNRNETIANPDLIAEGQGLRLPTLEGEPRALTAADRRSIAEGYLRLYRFFVAQGSANPQYALVGVRYFDASVLPERLRGTAAGHPGDTLAAAFQARLEAEFPLR